MDFKAGQYLMVVMGEKDKRPFSIASSPTRPNRELELHIGVADQNTYASQVVDLMRSALDTGADIEVDAPHGNAYLQDDSDRPLLLIAGGTGFSYVRSILDYMISLASLKPIYLYWGAKDQSQLYAKDELIELASQHDNIIFVPVVEQANDGWQGKIGNVLQAIEQDFVSLAEFDIYIAGRFEMAGVARDKFTQQKNAQRDRMFADAYAFI
jgi:aquacobalamin reductase/NAD(P)H-flavin reductase